MGDGIMSEESEAHIICQKCSDKECILCYWCPEGNHCDECIPLRMCAMSLIIKVKCSHDWKPLETDTDNKVNLYECQKCKLNKIEPHIKE